ncbi:HTH-type transcriptional activator RhaR [Paenibacillus solanacearum]|uniref:HTH-type transcriptional activator RhaR n=1 Tax=Paenibacillus solanacearum TaxID=2048548 RepID=A0A916NKZ0_9BACL|nr:helix-turn-helix domain-containing protein [Paenibacillus solanacearum]CAG7645305.1 HTH-type transcriptional activator RhaR [Paenibacillus solanacearum]
MRRQVQLPTFTENEYIILPESVGWYKRWPDHSVIRKAGSLNNFSIHLVLDGKGYVQTEKQLYTLQRGDAFLYFPLQEQRYFADPDDPWDVRWFHFYGDTLEDYLLNKGFHRSPVWTMRQWKPLEEAILALLEEAEAHGFLRMTRLSTLTYAALTEFTAHAASRSTANSPETENRIRVLLRKMQSEAAQPFDLDYWAGVAGVSTYYFCRLFRKTTQMTPMTFITLCRLQLSKRLLLEKEELTVREIAQQTGYPNVSYFNKRFLEQEGMTPTEYRELYHKRR